MGCWNETCMVTGLPIFNGNPCSIVFLLETPYYTNGCYASNAYTPIFIMDGIYNDYGCIEETNTEEYQALTNLLFACIPGGNNLSSEDRLARFTQDASNGHTIICHTTGVTPEAKAELHLYPVFLHGSIKECARQNMIDSHESFLSRYRNLLASAENNAYGTPSSDDDDTFNAYYRLCDYMTELVNHCLSSSAPNPAAKEFLTKCVQTDKKTAIPMIERLIETTCFLEDLRKAWHVPSGGGSQEGLTGAHTILHNLCGELIENMREDDDF